VRRDSLVGLSAAVLLGVLGTPFSGAPEAIADSSGGEASYVSSDSRPAVVDNEAGIYQVEAAEFLGFWSNSRAVFVARGSSELVEVDLITGAITRSFDIDTLLSQTKDGTTPLDVYTDVLSRDGNDYLLIVTTYFGSSAGLLNRLSVFDSLGEVVRVRDFDGGNPPFISAAGDRLFVPETGALQEWDWVNNTVTLIAENPETTRGETLILSAESAIITDDGRYMVLVGQGFYDSLVIDLELGTTSDPGWGRPFTADAAFELDILYDGDDIAGFSVLRYPLTIPGEPLADSGMIPPPDRVENFLGPTSFGFGANHPGTAVYALTDSALYSLDPTTLTPIGVVAVTIGDQPITSFFEVSPDGRFVVVNARFSLGSYVIFDTASLVFTSVEPPSPGPAESGDESAVEQPGGSGDVAANAGELPLPVLVVGLGLSILLAIGLTLWSRKTHTPADPHSGGDSQ
jgi:hypothetical protein